MPYVLGMSRLHDSLLASQRALCSIRLPEGTHFVLVHWKYVLCYKFSDDDDDAHREVTENRPHRIIKNKKDKIYMLINVAIPADRNFTQKEAENKLKKAGVYV